MSLELMQTLALFASVASHSADKDTNILQINIWRNKFVNT